MPCIGKTHQYKKEKKNQKPKTRSFSHTWRYPGSISSLFFSRPWRQPFGHKGHLSSSSSGRAQYCMEHRHKSWSVPCFSLPSPSRDCDCFCSSAGKANLLLQTPQSVYSRCNLTRGTVGNNHYAILTLNSSPGPFRQHLKPLPLSSFSPSKVQLKGSATCTIQERYPKG